MTALEQLDQYVKRLQTRLQLLAASKGTAVCTVTAVLLTLLLVWIGNRYKFADHLILPLRILLFSGIGVVIAVALAIPISRLSRRRVTLLIENRIPELNQRLITVSERHDQTNPFTELIAEDTLRVAHEHASNEPFGTAWIYTSLAVGAAALTLLLWVIFAGPGYWGYGASLLWTGSAHAAARPLYEVTVQPGNKTVRRKSDVSITAQTVGFSASDMRLHAKYRNSLKWEEIPMQPQPNGNGFQFTFAGVSDALEYYVQAGDSVSKKFLLGVKDLPGVRRVRVGLHFPAGIGLKDTVEDPGGDIRAVEGTRADISVLTDRPLEHGILVLEDNSKIALSRADGNWLTARLPINKDGSYHIAAIDDSQAIRISDDYFIEAKKDEPPSVRILKPGRDPHVSPIEELPVTVDAADDFGIKDLQLHYSVNGAPEETIPLAKGKSLKEAQGKTTLYFENFKVAPGDLVSFYATARDATHTTRSDIAFATAEPFDFKFRQSQQSGGGGSAADQGNNISERQKEIIAATWNQLREGNSDRAAINENARFLSDLEGKLSDQSKALAERMGNRDLQAIGPEFQKFSESMTKASEDMSTAVEQLRPGKWHDALPPEQKALQSLLQAEAIFREIQVAFGQNGGNGMGANGANRDLARLFDLELDTSKNQYETGQSASPSSGERQKQLDDAFERLQQLAKRQQELADQQRSQQQSLQQRWEEEQLRREAEQLRQQMQRLAENSQSQRRGQQSQSSRGNQTSASASASASGSRQSGQGADQARQNAESIQRSMQALQRAEEEMRNATSNHDPTAQQRASAQLAEAQRLMKDMLHQQAGNSMDELAQKAQQLAENQKQLGDKIKQLYGAQGVNTGGRRQPGDGNGNLEMPEMQGPGYAGGWYYRRRFSDLVPRRPPTDEEKGLAAQNEKLGRDLQQLQQQMQEQARGLAPQQPDAARKLRKALSDAEQQELALRLQKNSEWLRQGYGSQTWPMEDSLSAGMQQLHRQVEDAQQALQNAQSGAQNGQDEKMARALAQVRSLREQLEASKQASSQSRTGQGEGRPGESQDAQPGGQPGSISQWNPEGSGRAAIGGGARDTIESLSTLRAQLGRDDRQLNNYLNDTLGLLRHMNGQAGLLDARISQDTIASLERLEMELARSLGQRDAGARITAPESAPEKYRDAVAEYFRRLSK